MESKSHILVVVDPTQDYHPSIQRALAMCSVSQGDLALTFLLLASEQTRKSSDLTYLTCSDSWIQENITTPVSAANVEHRILISWTKDWPETLIDLEARLDPTMTVIPYYGHTSEYTLSDENWKLLRSAKKPILIARKREGEFQSRILASIKTQDERYQERNKTLIEGAKRLVDTFGVELHIVNAYSDSMEYPDRAKIATMAEVPNNFVHVKLGDPQDVICAVADEINPDIVLISSHKRQGLKGLLRGNTVEKIVDCVGRDILMI